MAKAFNNVKINTTFTTATAREQLTSGENLCTSLGKINKYLADLDAGAFASNGNILINSRFIINQRGTGKYTAPGYSLDGWKIGTLREGSAPIEVTRMSATTGTAHLKATAVSTLYGDLTQYVENAALYGNKPLTLSCWIGNTVNNEHAFLEICATRNGTAWQTYSTALKAGLNSITATVQAGIKQLAVRIRFSCENTTNYLAVTWIKLEAGSIVTPYIPTPPAIDLAMCQRYYQVRSAGNIAEVDLRPTMYKTPTVTQRTDGNYAYTAEL